MKSLHTKLLQVIMSVHGTESKKTVFNTELKTAHLIPEHLLWQTHSDEIELHSVGPPVKQLSPIYLYCCLGIPVNPFSPQNKQIKTRCHAQRGLKSATFGTFLMQERYIHPKIHTSFKRLKYLKHLFFVRPFENYISI